MTANGEVQKREEEATVYVKELDLFVTVMLLEETPAVLSLATHCEDPGFSYQCTSGQNPHLTKNGKRIDCKFSNYVPFVVPVVYQRVLPQLHLHLLLHHLHHRILYLMSTDTPKIQYKKEVEVRVRSYGETRCMKPQKPKTKIKMENQKKYLENYRMNCLIGYRNLGRINLLMKVLQQSLWETKSKEVKTLPSHLMNFQWSREQKWNQVRVSRHFPKDPNYDICLKTKITRASCRRCACTVVPRAEHFDDLITADHKVFSEEIESRNSHRHAVLVQDLATQWIQS